MIAAEARLDALSNSTIDDLGPWDWSEGHGTDKSGEAS